MSTTTLKCPCCGSSSYEFDATSGGYRCESCGSLFFDSSDAGIRGTIEEATDLRNNLECDKALRLLENATEKNQNSGLYFQKVLARYGVIYVKADGGKVVPTISLPSDESMFDTDDYKKCIECCKDDASRSYYNDQLAVLEDLRKKILAESNEVLPSDVIICCDDKSESSKRLAEEYYDLLTGGSMLHQYSVFYAPKSYDGVSEGMKEIVLSKALKTAKYMIVIAGPGAKGLSSAWNKNLLTRFFALVADDNRKRERNHGVLTVLDGSLENDLPSQVASDSTRICKPKESDFKGKLQQDLSCYVKKISTTASVSARQIEVQEVKPIVIVEAVIERKAFGKGKVTTMVEGSEKSKLDSALDLLKKNNSKNKYSRALRYANEILEKNPQSGSGAFVSVLCNYSCDNVHQLYEKDFSGLSAKQSLIPTIGITLEYGSEREYTERMKAYTTMLRSTVRHGHIQDAILIYKLLIQYSDDALALKTTKSCFHAMIKAIEEKVIKAPAQANELFETLYPMFTRGGDASTIVSYYDQLGVAWHCVGNYGEAINMYNKALEIYSVDPQALWNKMLAQKKCVFGNEYASRLAMKEEGKDFPIIEALITMMKGGYSISDDEDNYFARARQIAFDALASGKKHASVELYKDLISIIPLEYTDLRYSTMIIFPDLLCTKSMFKDAEMFYQNVLNDYQSDIQAYIGKLKCAAKARTVLDLLVLSKSLDDGPYRDYFNSITELEIQHNMDGSPIRNLNNLRDTIVDLIREERKKKNKTVKMATFKQGINAANIICAHDLISPSLEMIVEFFTKHRGANIKKCASDREYLARLFVETYILSERDAENNQLVEDKVKELTKNVSLHDSSRGIHLKRELLLILIPAAICWILFAGSMINFADVKEFFWPQGFLVVAGVIGGISLLIFLFIAGFWAILIGPIIGFAASGILCGAATGICFVLSELGSGALKDKGTFILIAILIALLPYLIYKIVDIVKKHKFINKRYIVFSVLMGILLILSPIIILLIK